MKTSDTLNPNPQDARLTQPSRCRAWIGGAGVVLALMVLALFRLHAFELPLETDECNYAYMGRALCDGQGLYVDLWDHQPPGVFVLFAGMISLFGDDPLVFRWMATAFSGVSLVLVFLILRRLVGLKPALLGAFLFALSSSDPGTAGEGANREIYMNAFILAAWWLAGVPHHPVPCRGTSARHATEGIDEPDRAASAFRDSFLLLCLLAGLSLAIASWIKPIVALHWLGLAVVVVACAVQGAGQRRLRRAALAVLALGIGPALWWLGTYLYFAADGRGAAFSEAVFQFNIDYTSSETGLAQQMLQFFAPPQHPFILYSSAVLWIAALVGVVVCCIALWRRREWALLSPLALGAASLVAVIAPGRFWPHYYYLLLPPGVMLSVLGVTRLAGLVPRSLAGHGRLAFACLGSVLLIGQTGMQYHAYLSQPLFGITVTRYNSRDFWGRAMGEKIRAVTRPQDSIFVYGNDTGLYYYADRRCASRFTMITGLRAGYAGVEARWQTALRELKQNKPRLIVLLFDDPPFPGFEAFLHKQYSDPIGFDYHDRTGKVIMMVVQRKDDPIEPCPDGYWSWHREEVGGWFVDAKGRRRESPAVGRAKTPERNP